MVRSLAAALIGASLLRCIDVRDAFVCTEASQCISETQAGTCEANGYCAFPDAACRSGRRFAEESDAASGRCVEVATVVRCVDDEDCKRAGGELCEETKYCSRADVACLSRRRYVDGAGDLSRTCVATGKVYYLSLSGDDANDGSETSPFRTIARAATVLLPGDALLIMEGEYRESTKPLSSGESWRKPITVAAAPGHVVTWRSPSAQSEALYVWPTQSYLEFADLHFVGGKDVNRPVVYIHGHHIRLRGGSVKDGFELGIRVSIPDEQASIRQSSFAELIGVEVTNNGLKYPPDPSVFGGGQVGGVLLKSADNLVEGCHIHHNYAAALQVYGKMADRNVIRGNFVRNCFTSHGIGVFIFEGVGSLVYNNIVAHTEFHPLVTYRSATFYNNTIFALQPVAVDATTTEVLLKNNLFAWETEIPMQMFDADRVTASNNLWSDPGFVDASALNFHLLPGSAAIDAGATLQEVTHDYDGVPRPQGSAFDIGAYEAPAVK